MGDCNRVWCYFASIDKGLNADFKGFTAFRFIKGVNITCQFKSFTIISLNDIDNVSVMTLPDHVRKFAHMLCSASRDRAWKSSDISPFEVDIFYLNVG